MYVRHTETQHEVGGMQSGDQWLKACIALYCIGPSAGLAVRGRYMCVYVYAQTYIADAMACLACWVVIAYRQVWTMDY